MYNFGHETWSIIKLHGYNRDDIDWIGCPQFQVEEAWFWTLADDTDYDAGYGRPKIPQDLTIVMKDGSWFERAEYDGSEWWRYIQSPIKPQNFKNFAYGKLCADFRIEDWAPQLKEFCDEMS